MMRRAPRHRWQPTVPRACAPRVRSVHSAERYDEAPRRRLRLHPLLRRSLATRTFSAAATTWPPAAFTAVAALTPRTFTTFTAGAAVVLGLGHAFRTREQRLHRQAKASALVAIDELDPNTVALLHHVFG